MLYIVVITTQGGDVVKIASDEGELFGIIEKHKSQSLVVYKGERVLDLS